MTNHSAPTVRKAVNHRIRLAVKAPTASDLAALNSAADRARTRHRATAPAAMPHPDSASQAMIVQ